MSIGNGRKRSLLIGAKLLLSLTLAVPALASPAGSVGDKLVLGSQELQSAQTAPDAKISTKLSKEFESSDYVSYLVKMTDQVNTTEVSRQALQKSTLLKATPSAAKLSARNAVVSALRQVTAETQGSVEKLLEKEKQNGNVKSFQSFFIVNALSVTSTRAVMEEIAKLPEVAKILPDEEHFLDKGVVTTSPSEAPATAPLEKEEVATEATSGAALAADPNVEWNIAAIGVPAVWDKGIDGTGIVVANLDSGVDYTHPALYSKWRAVNANGEVVNPELSWYDAHSGARLPADEDGHGTHTMGTMVGSEANGTNKIGVAPGAKWIAVRIFNPSTTDSVILAGAQWILAPVDAQGNLHPELAPDVVNNSWGGGAGLDEWFRPSVQAWRAAGIFPEFSAGNVKLTNPGGPGSVANPANYPESFATGATNINGQIADFSLRGPSPYGEIKPEVSAPGVNIRSSVPGGYEGGWNGTSMAGPHVTALAALLLQANHSLTVDQLEEIITQTADPRTDSQYPTTPNNGYGYGIINALAAVNEVLVGSGTVSGKVVTGGDDLEEPVIEHTPVTSAFSGLDITISARVRDDVSITAVEVQARKKGDSLFTSIPAARVSGDYRDGVYEAVIPGQLAAKPGLEYRIRVNDYGNNGYDSPLYPVQISDGVVPGYFEDFEASAYGFSTGGTGPAWQWGNPVSGPGAAYSGQNVVATNLTGTYAASSNVFLLSPPIDLSSSPRGAFVTFKHWYDIETNYDEGTVYLVKAGEEDALPLASFTGASGGWKTQNIDLTAYAGERVWLAFNLTSDNTVNKAGWYIDDFRVEAPDEVLPGAPINLTAVADTVGHVQLNWAPPADEDVKQFVVYRAQEAGDFAPITTTTATSYTDTVTAGVYGSPNDVLYTYKVAAQDFSGNTGPASDPASVTVHFATVLYSDHFDGTTDNGWTHSGVKDEWERGIPSGTGGPASAASLPNVWATDLDSTYENSADYSLYSPVIDLTGQPHAALNFSHWYEIETRYDAGTVEASKDGGATWTELLRFSSSTDGKKWSSVVYDLSAYVGGPVQFRFHLKTDTSVNKAGWYIDDFRITEDTAPTSVPTASRVELADGKVKNDSYLPELQSKTSLLSSAAAHGDIELESLPVGATVTVLETGRSVKADPATGRYSLRHAAGTYTLKAETYGYRAQTKTVTIAQGAEAKVNFSLEPIPHGILQGAVTDQRTGAPIAGAKVSVLEDAAITPATTDANGRYSLDVLEGTYTLSVIADEYHSITKSVTVTAAGLEQNIALKPFVGYSANIAYDDGTAENARAFNAANNGWAVRFTPESASAQVTGASFRFWNTQFPSPGGTAFQYAVYDASGTGGAPGRKLAGPFAGTALRNDQWTNVVFPSAVSVTGDFYIVYIQPQVGTLSPGLATDESSPNAGRSWQVVSGVWTKSPADEGNYMIRAAVRYDAGVPVLLAPEGGTITSQPAVTVNGTSPANGGEIRIYNGTALAATTTVQNGGFQAQVQLGEGDNSLTAEVVVNGAVSDRSLPLVYTLDSTAPVLDVTSPTDRLVTNTEVIRVDGTAQDLHLKEVKINGKAAALTNGAFAERLLVSEGENRITVEAIDLAGNVTTIIRTVTVHTVPPVITGVLPAADVRLAPGGSVKIAFDSNPGLTASFTISLPASPTTFVATETALKETAPGHYEGTFTAPASLRLSGGIITVTARDAAGNLATAQAAGKLYVEEPAAKPPVAVIVAPTKASLDLAIPYSAANSTAPAGKIVKYEWNFGDGSTASTAEVKHKFPKPGTYTVTLTVTDNTGATAKVTKNITIV
ncbi:S8 family serine peptidase [Gorillibacterium timonense]|uniref:S8 family serine peptidase n=1 Tax=Gorillibacterium timonense TaxID=1689269 RepID=UPI000A436A93|nr:S8 family serine peptidase [Gorillibacterium timonense]